MLNYLNCFKPINDINFIFASLGDGGNKFVLSSMPVFFFFYLFSWAFQTFVVCILNHSQKYQTMSIIQKSPGNTHILFFFLSRP